jgi:ATP-dependent RNA helicase DDX54/DBP10
MPTPVQRKALPVILTGSDTVVMARTGSGKTAAFLIPILEKLRENPTGTQKQKVRAIVLSPTRELSLQTLKVLNKLSHFCGIKAIGINGGEGMEKQFNALASKPDVIIATPGRLAHHCSEIPDFDLKGCQMCVLDEADRLLEMGFAAQIRQIAVTLPDFCQKVMLSATMPKILIEFTKSGFATDPQVVRLDNEATVSDELRIAFIACRSADKDAALLHVLEHIHRDKKENEANRTGLTLIFAATRHHVEYITALLSASGYDSTLIYGTLDQEARKSNLSAFRSGKKSILVVTDVAARGIDVPLIDHVIHYAFPANAKLFVHRSGRAARAGRIGYCWGLVEPDEMAYMVDLHLFLGRRLSTGVSAEGKETTYTLNEMTPEHVHYGSVPEAILTREVENVRRILESELTGSHQAETLRALTKVCNNAMKQYRRTRPEPSREGLRRAKAIMEGERQETGKRLGGGAILPHPVLRGMEQKDFQERKARGSIDKLHDVENLRKRDEFLRAMSNFRPKETVFEAFATGGGKDMGVVSQVDKGRTSGSKKHDSSAALTAMKHMRRQMRIAHDKGTTLVVAGTAGANDDDDEVEETPDETMEEPEKISTVAGVPEPKRRLSKAERKRMKKGEMADAAIAAHQHVDASKKTKEKRGNDFRDENFFMDNDFTSNTAEAARSRQIEAAMQPSASGNLKGITGAAIRLEEAMLDINGDETGDLAQKQRLMRWDKSKRKYIQSSVGEELTGDSKTKKMRTESGQLVKRDRAKLGELYEKWQKKTNRSIGRTGVFDDVTDAPVDETKTPKKQYGRAAKSGLGEFNVTSAKQKGAAEEYKNKLKTSTQIRKERETKSNNKLKNMKKGDRRRVEKDKRGEREPPKASGGKGKGKPSKGGGKKGRW